MSVTTNPQGSELRDDTLAELTQALESIARSTSEQAPSNEEFIKRKLRAPSGPPMFAAVLERLLRPGAPRLWSFGLLAVACIVAVVVARPVSDERAAKPITPLVVEAAKADPGVKQPSVQPQMAPERAAVAPISPEPTRWGQAIAHQLANLEQGIEQLKTSQAQLAHDTAELAGRLKETQDQMARRDVELAEALKAVRENMTRDNLSMAEQLKASQDQLASIGEQLKTSAAPKPPLRPPKATAPTPTPSVLSGIATTKPVPKPKPPQTPGRLPKSSTQSQPKQP